MLIDTLRFPLRSAPWMLAASLLVACGGDDGPAGNDETAGSETAGTDTGEDEIGDSSSTNGESSTTSEDTTSSTTDDGCPVGAEGCSCTPGGGCDPGLVCELGTCTAPSTTSDDTTTDTADTTDATTDTADTTDTTDGGGACNEDISFEIEAEAAVDIEGWNEQMSMLGEGVVLAWDNQTQDAFATWDIEIPCDDTWHIWVRAIDNQQSDSFFATVDGEPNPEAIFELDCTQGPQMGTYLWKELNYREQMAGSCEYLFDPWTQDWAAGTHELTLIYRESIAISKLWITNTENTPPQ